MSVQEKKTVAKPYPDFPLYAHKNGQWAKTINRKAYYFGSVNADYRTALARYCEVRDSINAGKVIPRKQKDSDGYGANVTDLCSAFLNAREKDVENGSLKQTSWNEYGRTANRILSGLDRRKPLTEIVPTDFERLRQSFAKEGLGPTSQRNEISRSRVIFAYAFDSGLVDVPLRYKKMLRAPAMRELRAAQAERPKLMEAREIRSLLESANGYLKPSIMLAINCGLGNRDIALIEIQHLDLSEGWLYFPRPKTGIARQSKLWPETIAAIQGFWSMFKPSEMAPKTRALCRNNGEEIEAADLPITNDFRRLCRRAAIGRPYGFYALRHTFRTIADDSGDQPAIAKVMGHALTSIDAVYRHRISDDRLCKVSNVVHAWLFSENSKIISQLPETPVA